MGTWQASEGSDVQLDPDVARIAGSSDHIDAELSGREDRRAGVGPRPLRPGRQVFGHTPDVCYPAAGYQLVKGPIDRTIAVPGVKDPVRYRWAIYMKRIGGVNRYEEAYYTFMHQRGMDARRLRLAGSRSAIIRASSRSRSSHPVSSLSETGDGPCEPLLAELVRQIEQPVARAKARQAADRRHRRRHPPEPGQKVPG